MKKNVSSEKYTNVSIEQLKNTYKNELLIWIAGTSNYQTKQATYFSLIEYRDHNIFLTNSFPDSTSNQIMIQGVIDAIEKLKDAKKLNQIIIITPTPLGFKSAKSGKGTNVKLIKKVVDSAEKKGYSVKEIANEGSGRAIKKYIVNHDLSGHVRDQLKKEDDIKKSKQNQYKQEIYKQCIKKVINILKINNVSSEIIKEVRQVKP